MRRGDAGASDPLALEAAALAVVRAFHRRTGGMALLELAAHRRCALLHRLGSALDCALSGDLRVAEQIHGLAWCVLALEEGGLGFDLARPLKLLGLEILQLLDDVLAIPRGVV